MIFFLFGPHSRESRPHGPQRPSWGPSSWPQGPKKDPSRGIRFWSSGLLGPRWGPRSGPQVPQGPQLGPFLQKKIDREIHDYNTKKKRIRIDDTGFCVNALEFTIQDIVGGGGGGGGGVN